MITLASTKSAPPVLTAALLLLGLLFLMLQRKQLRGWTLMAAWSWAVVSLVTIGLSEIFIGFLTSEPSSRAAWIDKVRYVAAVSSFCPAMSQMGAKRPQQQAWNFIVFSLWLVLALPAAKSFFLGGRLELDSIGGWFAWLLMLTTAANMLPTRFWLSALLAAAGQLLLLSPHLPLLQHDLAGAGVAGALGCFALAAAAAWWNLDARPLRDKDDPLSSSWIVFRDLYGALWGLRLAERFNAAARSSDWPLTLTWWGLQVHPPGARFQDLPLALQTAARQSLRNLWRRFAPDDWPVEEQGDQPPSSANR